MYHVTRTETLILCLTSTALASAPPFMGEHHPKTEVGAQRDSFSFNGKIAKVDYAANVVEMIANGRRVTVVVEPTTAIDIAGEPGSVSDIRPGVEIHAEGSVRKGAFIAQTITIHGGGKHKIHHSH